MEKALDMTARLLEVTREEVDRFVNTHQVKWSDGIDELVGYLQAQGKVLYVVSGSVEEVRNGADDDCRFVSPGVSDLESTRIISFVIASSLMRVGSVLDLTFLLQRVTMEGKRR